MSRSQTRAELDQAVRDHMASRLDPDEVLVGWAVVGVTRNSRDGGATLVCVDDGVPTWQLKGMMLSALDMARNPDDVEDTDD